MEVVLEVMSFRFSDRCGRHLVLVAIGIHKRSRNKGLADA